MSRGWKGEPTRHSLASKGIKTNWYPRRISQDVFGLKRYELESIFGQEWLEDVKIKRTPDYYTFDFKKEGTPVISSSIIIRDNEAEVALRFPKETDMKLLKSIFEKFNGDYPIVWGGAYEPNENLAYPHIKFNVKSSRLFSKPRYYYEFLENVLDRYNQILKEHKGDKK